MSERDERNIDVPLDNLDYEAAALGGLTYQELITTIVASYIFSIFITIPFAHFILGNFLYGFIASFVVAGLFTKSFMKKAYILKKDRPSYMIWIMLQKKIQHGGVFGIKIPLGFIPDGYWHTGVKKNEHN